MFLYFVAIEFLLKYGYYKKCDHSETMTDLIYFAVTSLSTTGLTWHL